MYNKIPFDGSVDGLPEYLSWFAVPVPRAFFRGVAKKRHERKKPYYTDDAYGIDRGNVFYSTKLAYELPWGEAVAKIDFALQVEAAATGQAGAAVRLALYRRDADTGGLAKERIIETTQRLLVDFLWSGNLSDLEHRS